MLNRSPISPRRPRQMDRHVAWIVPGILIPLAPALSEVVPTLTTFLPDEG